MSIFELSGKKSIFTRMCIGEAVADLLKETELKRLKVLAVVERSGFSRMTFYKYYTTPRAALEDYLQLVISEYVDSCGGDVLYDYLTYDRILHALNFFDKYSSLFLTLKRQGLYSLMIDGVNNFMNEHMKDLDKVSIYKRYAYGGSLLNCFLVWEEKGKKDSAEDVAKMIYDLVSV